MAYQILADLNAPLGRKYRSKARFCLSKAVALAPDRSDYRRALFTFLLDASGRSFFRQAADLARRGLGRNHAPDKLARTGSPDEIAGAVVFLASDDSSDITGIAQI